MGSQVRRFWLAFASLAAHALSIVFVHWPGHASAEAEPGVASQLGRHLLESPRLLGDPGGARSGLHDHGVGGTPGAGHLVLYALLPSLLFGPGLAMLRRLARVSLTPGLLRSSTNRRR